MEFFTIYSTRDEQEVSILKNVYEEEKIGYRILEPETSGTHEGQKRIQVAEKDREKARELLDQTGFLRVDSLHSHKPRRMPGKKWILIFLAALILVLVAILITWFMNVE
ncbi:putative signal transducing protein [Salinimicrobium xinjiangense]|uniref:putative signal transducing protein n=1 Tax=Salinimicrobium xinjiangense TaxID=438596 RepID=UPI00041D109E|nr:DUF2007 domain-containing protein [Salinimicrobium xinjiangense]